jgi:hypothetical protein
VKALEERTTMTRTNDDSSRSNPEDAGKVSFGEELQRLAARSGDTPLDAPFGPTPECYSIRHMVNLFRWGATADDVSHFSSCSACAEWANNYATSATGAAMPMLFVKDTVVSLSAGSTSMEVALIAGLADSGELDIDSVRLEGDLSSGDASLSTQEIDGSAYPVIRFDNLQVNDALRRDVEQHAIVVQRVTLTGRLLAGTHRLLSGRANVRVGEAPRA